jgi:hypothetical protein
MKQIFLNGKYQLTSTDSYFWEKYDDAIPVFQLEGTAKSILGKDWKKDHQTSVIRNFFDRMAKKGVDVYEIEDPILFGKIESSKSPYRFAEIVLFNEIKFTYSVEEFQDLLKKKKIKIEKIGQFYN